METEKRLSGRSNRKGDLFMIKIKHMYLLNIILTLVVFVGNYFYQSLDFNYPLKIFCSTVFLIQGLCNYRYMTAQKGADKKVLGWLALGILFSWGGDITINPSFAIGATVFALGHICFTMAYFRYRSVTRTDILICGGLGIFSVLFVIFFPYLVYDNPLFRYICIIYAGIIAFMVGKSVGNTIQENSRFTKLAALSSILFYFSDLMLLLEWFSTLDDGIGHVCMALYYPAMCLFGITLLFAEKGTRT